MNEFNELSTEKQSSLMLKQYKRIRAQSKIQWEQIKKIDLETDIHRFFYESVKSFWEDCDFVYYQRNSKNKGFAVQAARSTFEKCLKLIYLTKQSEEKRKDIIRKDLLNMCRRFYFITKRNEEDEAELWKMEYNDRKKQGDEEVDQRAGEISSFPNIPDMLKNFSIEEWETIYFMYKSLCDKVHFGFFHHMMTKNDSKGEYNRALFLMQRFAIEMLKVTDFHLLGDVGKDVKDFIEAEGKILDIYEK